MLDEIAALNRISYTYFGLSVQSHTHVAVSWTCHQLAGDTNTQNHVNVGSSNHRHLMAGNADTMTYV